MVHKDRLNLVSHWLIDSLSDQQLYSFVKKMGGIVQTVFHGFKINVKNAGRKTIRNRIRNIILNDYDFYMLYLNNPQAPWSNWIVAINSLDEKWILQNWRDIASNVNINHFTIALVVSLERKKLATLGNRLLLCPSLWQSNVKNELIKKPPQSWLALQQICNAQINPVNREKPSKNINNSPALLQKIQNLEKELKKTREQYAKLKNKLKESEQLVVATKNIQSDKMKLLRKEIKISQQNYDALNAEISKIVQQYKAEVDATVLGISPQLRMINDNLKKLESSDLLQRGEMILEQQEQNNLKYGTFAGVRKKITQLQNLQNRVKQGLNESVNILPEMHAFHKELINKITELQQYLPDINSTSAQTDFAFELGLRINLANSQTNAIAKLREIAGLLENRLLVACLHHTEVKKLKTMCQEKITYHEERKTNQALQNMLAEETKQKQKRATEIWDIKSFLNKFNSNKKIYIYVDAYNLLKRVDEFKKIEKSLSLLQARDYLIKMCRKNSPSSVKTELIFDGRDALSNRETQDGVTVVFSAKKTERQNADSYIIQYLQEFADKDSIIILVSEDYGLREQIKEQVNHFVTCHHFYEFIK